MGRFEESANWVGGEFLPADLTKSAVADLRISANGKDFYQQI